MHSADNDVIQDVEEEICGMTSSYNLKFAADGSIENHRVDF